MDLYEFIENDLAKLSKENEDEDAVALLKSRKDAFATSREVLLERVSSLENHIAELEKERNDLASKLNVAVTDKEGLLVRITSLENLADTLEQQRNDLQTQLQALSAEKDNALREAGSMLKGKASEIEQLKIDISSFRQELSDSIVRLERVESEKRACLNDLERVRQNFSLYMQKTKRAIVIACITVLVIAAGLLVYYTKSRAIKTEPAARPASADNRSVTADARRSLQVAGFQSSQPQVRIKNSVSARWPGRPFALNVGDFRISVIPLKSDAVKRLPATLSQKETDTHYFYVVKIRARRGALSAEFLKSPSIDFVNRNNSRSLHTGSGSEVRVVYTSMSRRRHSQRRTVLLRCLVSLSNDFQPIGIIIGPLNKETRRIVIV
ncbi:MAG: hypothetical protein HQL08_09980 [Nitrospirae bacterium]|nr:hypothetical protein [Nitrospirota bacterium]